MPGTVLGTGAQWEELATRAKVGKAPEFMGSHSDVQVMCCEEKQAAVIEETRRASWRWCGREVIFVLRPNG